MSPSALELVEADCVSVLTPEVVARLEPLRGEHIVITGGTGFVGTWLAEILARLNDGSGFGARVTLTGCRTKPFRARVPHLASRADIDVVEQDIRDTVELPEDTTWVIHAAGSPDSRLHASDPVRTLQTFVHGTDALLRAASRVEPLRKILFLSSGLVYGPQPLDVERLGERVRGACDFGTVESAYIEAKRAAETLCAAYRSEHRLPTVVARPFAFIGPYQALSAPWAVNNFLQDGLHGGPVRILGNGETTRSYMYPSDMAVWMLTLALHGRPGGEYNVGSERGVTLRELASAVAEECGRTVEVVEGGPGRRPTSASRFVPDTRIARNDLGLVETVDLGTAIARTVAWHRASSAAATPRDRAPDRTRSQ
jgi:nucleoside-diphosphate-sugar epimerase